MSRKFNWERARQREKLRDLPPTSTPRRARGGLDVFQKLTILHAHLVPPTHTKPYWQVLVDQTNRYLGAGKTPIRAVRAAFRRYHKI